MNRIFLGATTFATLLAASSAHAELGTVNSLATLSYISGENTNAAWNSSAYGWGGDSNAELTLNIVESAEVSDAIKFHFQMLRQDRFGLNLSSPSLGFEVDYGNASIFAMWGAHIEREVLYGNDRTAFAAVALDYDTVSRGDGDYEMNWSRKSFTTGADLVIGGTYDVGFGKFAGSVNDEALTNGTDNKFIDIQFSHTPEENGFSYGVFVNRWERYANNVHTQTRQSFGVAAGYYGENFTVLTQYTLDDRPLVGGSWGSGTSGEDLKIAAEVDFSENFSATLGLTSFLLGDNAQESYILTGKYKINDSVRLFAGANTLKRHNVSTNVVSVSGDYFFTGIELKL